MGLSYYSNIFSLFFSLSINENILIIHNVNDKITSFVSPCNENKHDYSFESNLSALIIRCN